LKRLKVERNISVIFKSNSFIIVEQNFISSYLWAYNTPTERGDEEVRASAGT